MVLDSLDRLQLSDYTTSGAGPYPRQDSVVLEIDSKSTAFTGDIIVFGGWCRGGFNNIVSDQYFQDVYVLHVSIEDVVMSSSSDQVPHMTWHLIKTSGTEPCPRAASSGCILGNYLYIFGGGSLWTNGRVFNDVFSLDLSSWTWNEEVIQGTAPRARQGHACIPLSDNMGLIVVGGTDNAHSPTAFADINVLHLPSSGMSKRWSRPELPSLVPFPYSGMTSTTTSLSGGGNQRALIFGGASWVDHVASVSKNFYSLDLDTLEWESILVDNTRPSSSNRARPKHRRLQNTWPHSRFAHAACCMDNFLLIHGGWGFKELDDEQDTLDRGDDNDCLYFSDCYAFCLTSRKWVGIPGLKRTLGARFGHSMISLPRLGLLLVILGHDGVAHHSDVVVLSSHRSVFEGFDAASRSTNVALLRRYSPSSLSTQFVALLDSEDYSDIRLVVGGSADIICAHRCVLSTRSEVFHAMLSKRFKEGDQAVVKVESTSPEVFRSFLQCLYGRSLSEVATADNVTDILELAERFRVLDVKYACEKLLCIQTDLNNVLCLFRYAEAYSCPYLLDRCLRVIYERDKKHSIPEFEQSLELLKTDFETVFAEYEEYAMNGSIIK